MSWNIGTLSHTTINAQYYIHILPKNKFKYVPQANSASLSDLNKVSVSDISDVNTTGNILATSLKTYANS